MELEEPKDRFDPEIDHRPLMPEPPPVRLISIDDVHVPAAAGMEVHLDELYVGVLKFEREGHDEGLVVYKAENFRLCFDILEPPIRRDNMRPIPIEIPSLPTVEHQLIDRKIEYLWERGISAGLDHLLFQDPAGNWIALTERREII